MQKLEHYLILSGAFLAMGSVADAQVVYTDLDPDLYTDGDLQALDVDADGIDDFAFYMYFYTSWFDVQYSMVYMQVLHSNAAIANTPYIMWIPPTGAIAMDYGDEIGPTVNFDMPPGEESAILAALQSYNPGFSCSSTSFSPNDNLFFGFPGTENGFVGIRTGVPGDYHYGWIRLSVPYHVVCTVPLGQSFELIAHDFALNMTANDPILAGEGIPADCPPPVPMTPLIGTTAAKIMWEPVADADGYFVQYREVGAAVWNEKSIPAIKTAKLIKFLECNTAYEWQVSSICDGGTTISDPCPVQSFTTAVCRMDNADAETNEITIYPNPVADILHIATLEDIFSIQVTTLSGQSADAIVELNSDVITVDMHNLTEGLYLVRMETPNGTTVKKISKTH